MDEQSEKTPDEAADTHNLRAEMSDPREYAKRAYLLVSEVRNDPNPVSSDRRVHSLEERVHILEQQVDILAAALSKFASTV